jgi:hypothetical protein
MTFSYAMGRPSLHFEELEELLPHERPKRGNLLVAVDGTATPSATTSNP